MGLDNLAVFLGLSVSNFAVTRWQEIVQHFFVSLARTPKLLLGVTERLINGILVIQLGTLRRNVLCVAVFVLDSIYLFLITFVKNNFYVSMVYYYLGNTFKGDPLVLLHVSLSHKLQV